MDVDRHDPGVPNWVDLGAPDVDAAAEFYSALLGWDVQPGTDETGGYRMCLLRGRAAAGLGPAQNPGPPFWTSYVCVDSVEDVTARVEAAGGSVIVPAMDVLEFGRMAVFADATGAMVSVWQPGLHIGAQVVNEPGAFCWNELLTSDAERSAAFYAQVFGWDARRSDGPMAYTEWQLAGRSVGGMMDRPPGYPAEAPDSWSVYFAVDDCDAAVAHARDLGATVMMEPFDTPAGRVAVLADPQGAAFDLIAMPS